MNDIELNDFVNIRDHELCQDEILSVLDITKNPTVSSFKYVDGWYNVYTENGTELYFKKREW